MTKEIYQKNVIHTKSLLISYSSIGDTHLFFIYLLSFSSSPIITWDRCGWKCLNNRQTEEEERTKGPDDIVGVQNQSPQYAPLWYVDCFKLKVTETLQDQEKLLFLSSKLPRRIWIRRLARNKKLSEITFFDPSVWQV